ncbi:ankyrin [Nemania sp. FL0916]|nr:ankyrin [Nemania sp. FL0916]
MPKAKKSKKSRMDTRISKLRDKWRRKIAPATMPTLPNTIRNRSPSSETLNSPAKILTDLTSKPRRSKLTISRRISPRSRAEPISHRNTKQVTPSATSKKRPLRREKDEAAYPSKKKPKLNFLADQNFSRTADHEILSPDQYTVGWISAIEIEYTAAQLLFDKRHDGPIERNPQDNNVYELGRIGGHNVVMTVLPEGEYGIAAAAMVARDMVRTFPNVRVGLMVGIGGAAPTKKNDIRLGDIVVSAPSSGKGGVFQYDFGKTIQDQSFHITGFLDQPPSFLRSAAQGLKSFYRTHKHALEETIDDVLEASPGVRKDYCRPDPSTDRLYKHNVVHPILEEDCTQCGTNPSNLVVREERENMRRPVVHFGLIASANQVMKDAKIRDMLAKKEGVLCFEMEAAGLMNHFPCLVIRGMCDYSDSHQNKQWQGYAALAAAVYAKHLLLQVAPTVVQSTSRMRDILEDIQREQQDKQKQTILDWFTKADYTSEHNLNCRRREPGTGQWLLLSDQYAAWKKTPGRTLFCPGIPGAGKTMIMATVIDDLIQQYKDDPTVGIAYMYFRFFSDAKPTEQDLYAVLLRQLLQKRPRISDNIKQIYYEANGHGQANHKEVSEAFNYAFAMYARVFIIVDALDESQMPDVHLREFLSKLSKIQNLRPVNLIATSRHITAITGMFSTNDTLEIRASKEDVRLYLSRCMSSLPSYHPMSQNFQLQNDATDKIIDSIDGMFILASLHFLALKSQSTIGDVEEALQNLSADMSKTYDEAMERIKRHGTGFQRSATNALSWVMHGKRTFTLSEIRHALGIKLGKQELDEKYIPPLEMLGSVCAGLLVIDDSNDAVRLAHYTTQEYFDLKRNQWFPEAEADIAKACLTYLSFKAFENGPCPTYKEYVARLDTHPLYDYAARHWSRHVFDAYQNGSDITNHNLEFLQDAKKVSASYQAEVADHLYIGYNQWCVKETTGAHIAARSGLLPVIKALIQKGHDICSKDSYGETPLSYAQQNHHVGMVQLLLDTDDIDVNQRDPGGRTPLLWATEYDYRDLATSLMNKKGVALEEKDNRARTIIHLAAKNDNVLLMRRLFEKGVRGNDRDCNDWTPLGWAALYGHTDAVIELLRQTVDLNAIGDEGHTPMSLAAGAGQETVVKLLLEHQAEKVITNTLDSWNRSPLSRAAAAGHEGIVRLLLDVATLNIQDQDGRTALSWAAENGHVSVVKLMLDYQGINIEVKDNWGKTALDLANGRGHTAVVGMLQGAIFLH